MHDALSGEVELTNMAVSPLVDVLCTHRLRVQLATVLHLFCAIKEGVALGLFHGRVCSYF
jgi:hypothetical protein